MRPTIFQSSPNPHPVYSYDKLVIAVGSVSSTHGVAGLENCFQLKSIADALKIRRRIMGKRYDDHLFTVQAYLRTDNFESASLPTTTSEERRRLLSFVVCGGGPTGVEAAAEIYDLCQEDIMQYYPKICRQEVSIHVIQSGEHILNTVRSIVGCSRSFTSHPYASVLRSYFQVCRGRLFLKSSPNWS